VTRGYRGRAGDGSVWLGGLEEKRKDVLKNWKGDGGALGDEGGR